MAMTGRELVNHLAGGDPARLKRFKVRFTKIVLPGDELTTRAWLVEENDAVTTYGVETLNQDGDLVIGNALVEIAK
jgi:acyl dehydratase